MKPHNHAELIKTWVDNQDAVRFQCKLGDEWRTVSLNCLMYQPDRYLYRIDPNCRYAKEKIRELGGDEAVELYEYWLGGGVTEVRNNCYIGTSTPFSEIEVTDDPLQYFKIYLNGHQLRKKKQTVKQVLWVWVSSEVITGGERVIETELWVEAGIDYKERFNDCWHKVPTCTREVEV